MTEGHIQGGTRTGPDGKTYGIDSRSLLKDGKPWMPVMGEFHYSRYPSHHWEEAIMAMKAGGIDIIATYVFWIFHEEVRGEYNWQGNMDLNRFLSLCKKHHMPVWLRIGPWAHGEAKNGGFPDWLYDVCEPRTLDPDYFDEVDRWYQAVADQSREYIHASGGPVLGVQLDNEFGHVGGKGGEEYILKCKALARKHGLDVPYYSVCGWGGAWVPRDEVIPVQASYVDPFWGMAPLWHSNAERLPAPRELIFSDFEKMVSTSQVGGGYRDELPVQFNLKYDFNRYPFAMAELGCDMLPSYGRRPVLGVKDNLGNVLCRLGEGSNLVGYYMYHGGSQPRGKSGFLGVEGTTRDNSMAKVSYDFGVLSEYGKRRPSYDYIKRLHGFIDSYGEKLVSMSVSFPRQVPEPDDPSRLRYVIRSNGKSGYLFFMNHQRYVDMPARKHIRFNIDLNAGDLTFPEKPITIPSGAMGIFPFNQKLGSARLVYATLQPLMDLSSENQKRYVYFAIPGIPPEMAFQEVKGIRGLTGKQYDQKESQWMVHPPLNQAFQLELEDGSNIEVLVLDEKASLDAWKIEKNGRRYLALCEDEVFQDQDELVLRSTHLTEKNLLIYPRPGALSDANSKLQLFPSSESTAGNRSRLQEDAVHNKTFQRYTIDYGEPIHIEADYRQVQPMKAGAELPADSLQPAVWDIALEQVPWNEVSDVIMQIRYTGDVAELYLNGRLVADNLWRQPVWELGLKKWKQELMKPDAQLQLKITPWKNGQDVFVNQRPQVTDTYTARINAIDCKVEKKVRIGLR